MNKNEKQFVTKSTKREIQFLTLVFYSLSLSLASAFSILQGKTSAVVIVALLAGFFGAGWFCSQLDVEHRKSKEAKKEPETKPKSKDLEDEDEWRKLLVKRGPLE